MVFRYCTVKREEHLNRNRKSLKRKRKKRERKRKKEKERERTRKNEKEKQYYLGSNLLNFAVRMGSGEPG